MKWFIGVLLCVALCAATHRKTDTKSGDLRALFRAWQLRHGKKYDGLRSTLERFREFQRSARLIDLANSLQGQWTADFTFFADMTEAEKRAYTGLNVTEDESPRYTGPMMELDGSDPEKQYWEFPEAQNQWSCGSCWAFAAVGVLDGRHLKETGVYRKFSEQTLLDCVFESNDRDGCNGGWSDLAVSWTTNSHWNKNVKTNHGYLAFADDNPYKGSDGECVDNKKPFPNAMKYAKPKSYGAGWKTKNDAGLQHALATEGPCIVYIYSSWALPFYTTGTFVGTGCGENPTANHAVVAAGYEKDYWYIRNSWGSSWGYSGYVYFSRSYENLCSVSQNRKITDWYPNKYYSMCPDTAEKEREPCSDDTDKDLDPAGDCERRGCCWDGAARDARKRCFVKGRLTVYDGAGHRRVLSGSVADFTELNFAATATEVEAEVGTWILYADNDWWNSPVKVISPADGRVKMDVQSVRVINARNTIHLFAYSNYVGNKLSLAHATDKLEYEFNDDVSSLIGFGKWEVCAGEALKVPCQRINGYTFQNEMTKLCDDCVSSIG